MAALGETIVQALLEFLELLVSPISGMIETYAPALLDTIVSTPYPNAVFARPTNGAWPAIYDYYWATLVPLSLFLWGLALGLVILLESTSHLFSGYHRARLKRRAVSGLLGVLAWWWIAALSLQFTDALTAYLVPTLDDLSLFETTSFAAIGVLGVVISLTVDLVLFLLLALLYLVRQVALYLFVLLMPILIVLWVPGVGPFALAARFMTKLAGFYVPFLFMTVPVALLFRLGELLGEGFGLSMAGLGAWLLALVIPVAAVLSPLVLFWLGGHLWSTGERLAGHADRSRAAARTAAARDRSETARRGGRNFRRGLTGEPAVRPDGQAVFETTGPRAHAAGSRLRSTGRTLRSASRAPLRTPDTRESDAASASDHETAVQALRERGEPTGDPNPGRVDDDRPPGID